MKTSWECRYSSSEMMYLEVHKTEVRMYLHHSPHNADTFTFDEVLAGRIDADVRNLFGKEVPDELKAAVYDRIEFPDGHVETKEQMRIRRRREWKEQHPPG